ncbi:MAG: cytochrome c biogenesis protein ResB [Bacteroidaceae bacterium]|nr:cytochrome c biogenesis protein ResB [Bacteroidaceae bacterium]
MKKHAGLLVGILLIVLGLVLQAITGPLDWQSAGKYAIAIAVPVIIVIPFLTGCSGLVTGWLGSTRSATASIAWTLAVTVVMGLIRQDGAAADYGMTSSFPGFRNMLSNWSFILIYLWLLLSISFAVCRVCFPMTVKKIPFLLNHAGLFLALTAGVISAAWSCSYRMTMAKGEKLSQAVSRLGNMETLPLSIELKDLDVSFFSEADAGTGTAAVPKQFVSTVAVKLVSDGPGREFQVRVNHPARVGRWHIYQYGYDDIAETSTLLVISDRWRPVVGFGLLLMLAGAISLFVQTSRRKEN